MAITVKHSKVSTIPDDADTSLVRPSDWNADHSLTGTVPVDNGGTGASTLTGYVKGNGTSAMTATTTIPSTDVTGLGTMSTQNSNNISVTGGSMSGVTISDYIATTQKGVANGVASLDGSGTVPISQLPAAVIGALSYQGTWNASTNIPTLTTSVGTKGYYYVVNVAGSTNLNGITDWQVGDWAVYNGTAWQKIDNTDAVTSVNGYTGTVVLTAADVGAVPYTGATAAVDLNNKSLTDVSHLGINTTSVPDILLRAFGDNNSSSRIAVRGYSSDANSSAIRVAKFRGTYASPQAPLSGDSLGKFELAGYGTTSSSGYPQASLEGVATENWGATARGTKAVVKVTPNTTTTQVTALTIDQNSAATFASTVTANGVLLTGNTGTVTSVAATAGTGISITGSPITTSGTLNITNSAPDQTVVLTAGTGISTSGTYPNFTITNTSPSSGGTVTSVSGTTGRITSTGGATPVIDLASGVATAGTTGSATLIPVVTIDTYGRVTSITTAANPQGTVTSVTGTSPVVSSGGATPAISMPAATTSVSGYLTSTDWNTFNSKGSGTVTSVTGTAPVVSSGGATPAISMAAANTTTNGYLTSTDWNTFNGKGSGSVTSVSGTGTVNGISLSGTVTSSGSLTLGGTLSNVSLATQVTGNLPVTNLGSGTSASSSTFWRGDGTWAAPTVSIAAPQVTKYTSGSGTYTTPTNCKYLYIKMVGAGGGGGGSGGGGQGGTGGNTTFGSSLLTANGGGGGVSGNFGTSGGTGGTSTLSSPATGLAITGNAGGSYPGGSYNTTTVYTAGGFGGISLIGSSSAGSDGVYGAGGAGGGSSGTPIVVGNGGAAGGYIEALITSPSSTYSYAIGAGGSGGTAGTAGVVGYAGGAGLIYIVAYF